MFADCVGLTTSGTRLIRQLLLIVTGLAVFGVMAAEAGAAKKPSIAVYPSAGTKVASDVTTFSFRGIKPKNMGPIKVRGARSGWHKGRRMAHPDRQGVSWISVKPKRFVRGEWVTVFTNRNVVRSKNGRFRVRIGRFYGNDDRPVGPGTEVPSDGLHSRPDLKPPSIDVHTTTPQAEDGKIFFAPKEDGLTIANNDGKIYWFNPIGFGTRGNHVWAFQRRTLNGKPILTYWKGPSKSQEASSVGRFSQVGRYEVLDENYKRIHVIKPANGYGANIHEFEITPRNTALIAAYKGVTRDLRSVGGKKNGRILDNIVQELDIKTGAVLFEWHGIGNVGIKSSEEPVPKDGSLWDYLHVNAAKADGNSFLLSARRMSTIYRVDKKTTRVRWRLRGDGKKKWSNDFELEPGTAFGYQHDMKRLPNGDISLFDNSLNRPESPQPNVNEESSALVLKLSAPDGKRTASLVKRYNHPDTVLARSQGSAEMLPGGNMFVGWGSVSRMTEFAPDGSVVFDATVPNVEASSYRAQKAQWTGVPKGRVAIASEADGTGATVWVSWNGATNIAEWKVFTGSDENDLQLAATEPWGDLETEIEVPNVGAVIQAVAYNADGEELSRSGVVAIGEQSR